MPFNALIIGAGNIGAFYDTPASEMVLTHGHAFQKHGGFKLVGYVDVDKHRSREAAALWGGEGFSSIAEAFDKQNIDVVCVAVPDDQHYPVLKQLSKYPLKLVFTEKPLAKTLDEARDVVRIYEQKSIPVAVNYTRRFVREFQKIKRLADENAFGKFICGSGLYGKGLLHNGSHLIDLLRYFIGDDMFSVVPVNSSPDCYADDRSVSAILHFSNNARFMLNYIDCNLFTIFEMDLLYAKKRIRITDLGFTIEEYDLRENPTFAGYRNIVKVKETKTSLGSAMYSAVNNIHEHLTFGKKLKCSLQDGYKAMEACLRIREHYE